MATGTCYRAFQDVALTPQADLVALLNESAFGTPGTGSGPPPPDSNIAPVFENLLDDFTLWQ